MSLLNDPILQAMDNPSVRWGDLFWPDIQRMEAEADAKLPKLQQRKDIWLNYPVHVIPIGFDKEGHELHKVVWNTSLTTPNVDTESQLLRALHLSNKWTLLDFDDQSIITILRMNKSGLFRGEDVVVSEIRPLESIKEISNRYPVNWKQLDTNEYGISIHRKRLNDFMRLKGYNCIHEIVNSLYSSILLNPNWKILHGAGNHFLRIYVNP